MANESLKNLKPGRVKWLERGLFVRRSKDGELRFGISYTHEGRRYREIVGTSKTLARDALRIRKSEITQGRFNIPTKKKAPSVTELCDRYGEHAKEHKRSWTRDAGVMEKFKGFIGAKRIDKVTAWDIQRYQRKSIETVTKASGNRELAIIKRMFALAVTWGMIKENPAADVKLYREAERTIRTLDQGEQDALLGACSEKIRPLVLTALFTGMRRGELFNLCWENVDLERGLITVEKTKSGRIRHIPINTALKSLLESLGGPREGFVFKWQGKQFTSIQKLFNRAVKVAGIRKCRFHDLRHCFASNLVLGGVDLVTVQQLLGHANIAMTVRYSHPSEETKKWAVEMLLKKFQSGTKVAHGEKAADSQNS